MNSNKTWPFIVTGVTISIVFIAAFILKFKGYEISDKPSDWADFATYLGGTIGTTFAATSAFFLWQTFNAQTKSLDIQARALKLQNKELKVKHFKSCVDEMERYFKDKRDNQKLRNLIKSYASHANDIRAELNKVLVTMLITAVSYAYLLEQYRSLLSDDEVKADITLRSSFGDFFGEMFNVITPEIVAPGVVNQWMKRLLLENLPVEPEVVEAAIGPRA